MSQEAYYDDPLKVPVGKDFVPKMPSPRLSLWERWTAWRDAKAALKHLDTPKPMGKLWYEWGGIRLRKPGSK